MHAKGPANAGPFCYVRSTPTPPLHVESVTTALPDNLAEIIGAVVTLVSAIWAAFKRGRKVGHDAAMGNRE